MSEFELLAQDSSRKQAEEQRDRKIIKSCSQVLKRDQKYVAELLRKVGK
ncbi:hypothetical protein BANRA_05453 [Klebsiella pneumoniae]|nr:hypothetical protein BANRA_05453 [Klebsiella pneumoniae]